MAWISSQKSLSVRVEINKTNMKIRKFQLAVLAGLAGATLSVHETHEAAP